VFQSSAKQKRPALLQTFKAVESRGLEPLSKQFQFLYGAIQTKGTLFGAYNAITFQFQYGSIQTMLDSGPRRHNCSFNSSMVRFKLASSHTCNPVILFQFLYGAIQTIPVILGTLELTSIQFLYGTIQTDGKNVIEVNNARFQFLYGAIQTLPYLDLPRLLLCFNSCMVRFKPSPVNAVM
jgi:hypothetical protein